MYIIPKYGIRTKEATELNLALLFYWIRKYAERRRRALDIRVNLIPKRNR